MKLPPHSGMPYPGIVSKLLTLVLLAAGMSVVAVGPPSARGQSASEKPTLLRWKFAKGQQLQFQLVQDMTTVVSSQSSTLTLDMTWHVDSVSNDGTASISQTIDRMRVQARSGSQPSQEIDSAKEDAESDVAKRAAPVFKAMIGKPGRMKMSPLGKISSVELPEGMADQLKNTAALGPMAGLFNEAAFKQVMESAGLELPEKAVTKGQTWTKSQEIKNPVFGRQTVKTTYTFEGIENRGGRTLAKIAPELEWAFPEGDKSMELGDQESSGTIYFDTTSGKVAQSDVENTVQLNVNFMGQKFTEEIGAVTSLRLVSSGAEAKAADSKDSKTTKKKPQ